MRAVLQEVVRDANQAPMVRASALAALGYFSDTETAQDLALGFSDPILRLGAIRGMGRNADPRWLLPILCRRGEVDRRQIGRIEVRDDETRFEVSRAAASHFRRAAARPDKKDPNVRITEVSGRDARARGQVDA